MPEMIMISEAARRLRVERRTISRWAKKGLLEITRDHRGWSFIPLAQVVRLAKKLNVEGSPSINR